MQTAGGGWTLAMRTMAGGDTFNYDGPLWTNTDTLNELNFADGGFPSVPSEAKFPAFNVMPVSEVLIKSQLTSRFSQLGLPRVTPLLDLFKSPSSILSFISGDARPQRLMSNGNDPICDAAWRTNSRTGSAARVRLGGYFFKSWNCEYGLDDQQQKTSPEMAGIGLFDNAWAPFRTTVCTSPNLQRFNFSDRLPFN